MSKIKSEKVEKKIVCSEQMMERAINSSTLCDPVIRNNRVVGMRLRQLIDVIEIDENKLPQEIDVLNVDDKDKEIVMSIFRI